MCPPGESAVFLEENRRERSGGGERRRHNVGHSTSGPAKANAQEFVPDCVLHDTSTAPGTYKHENINVSSSLIYSVLAQKSWRGWQDPHQRVLIETLG